MILLNDIYKAWLKDKLDSTPFALPGLYQPASLIPLSIWKACPSMTNGNEQAHQNAYQEGINLTLLAGIMKGMKYDQTVMASIDTHSTFGINTHDAQATHAFQAARTVSQKGSLFTGISHTPYKHSNIHSQVTVHQKHIFSIKDIVVCTPADRQPSNLEPTPSSIHIPPTSSQLSKMSSLMWALVPHAWIIDYIPPPIVFNSIAMEYPRDLDVPLSSYSSLAGAVDNPLIQKKPSSSPQLLATDSFCNQFSSLTSMSNLHKHHKLHKL